MRYACHVSRSKDRTPTEIDTALEALYTAFVQYSGTHLEGCAHCVSFDDSAALRRAPLRKLGHELQRYLFKAMTTWGTTDDFKHFLPRLVELYASSSDAWLLCDKLAYGSWRSWPKDEQTAIERYLAALWRDELSAYGAPLPGNALLGTMTTLGLDLASYDLCNKLESWRLENSRASAQHLAQFVLEHGATLFWSSPTTGRLTLWQVKHEMADDVRSWLLELATRDWLEAAFVAHNDPDVARAFDWLDAAARER